MILKICQVVTIAIVVAITGILVFADTNFEAGLQNLKSVLES